MIRVDRFVAKRGYVNIGEFTPDDPAGDAEVVVPLLELSSRIASLVLGEPGAGKSTALLGLREALVAAGREVHLVDLRNCFSDVGLESAFKELPAGGDEHDRARVLLVDSIDEAPGLIRNYVRFLDHRLRELTSRGWRVIAACRTAESVQALDALFEQIDEGAVHVLLPLRLADATLIAASQGVDAESFIAGVRQKGLEALAAVPFTLNLLCRVYSPTSGFPGSRAEIFEKSIGLIVGESSVDGYAPNQADDFEPIRQRLAAERLAAFATFSDSAGFGLFRMGEATTGVATEFLVGSEYEGGVRFDLTNRDFQQLLKTPLFADSGANERQFAHRRLRDYLAARFLARQALDEGQMRSFLLVSDGTASIPPQMIDVTTWLVTLDPERFDWLVVADPLSLVRNRVTEDRPDLAGRLVAGLLERPFEVDWLLSWRDELSGLEHDDLAAQIGASLSKGDADQHLALRLLRDSYVDGLIDRLVEVARDNARSIRVRKLAVEVLGENAGARLEDLSDLDETFFEADAEAELRGAVIDTLWPRYLTPTQLIGLLVPEPERFFGSYTVALRRLERELTPELAILLAGGVMSEDGTQGRRPRGLRSLVDAAVAYLAEQVEPSRRADIAIVKTVLRRLRQDRKLPLRLSSMTDERRRDLIAAVVEMGASKVGSAAFLMLHAVDLDGHSIISRADLDWMSSRAEQTAAAQKRAAWVAVIDRVLDSASHEDLEWAWAQQGGILWPTLRQRFDAIDLDSEQASEARDHWKWMRRAQRSPKARGMSKVDYGASLDRLVDTVQGNSEAFWHLCRWLDVDLEVGRYNTNFEPDLFKLPGIEYLDSTRQAILLKLAASYLTAPPLPSRLKRSTLYFTMVAAYQALHTLEIHDSAALEQVPSEGWRALITATLEFPLDAPDELAVRRRVLDRAMRQNPVGVREALRAHFRRVARGQSGSSSLSNLSDLLDAESIPALRTMITSDRSRQRRDAFRLYLEADLTRANAWAGKRVAGGSKSSEEVATLLGELLDREPVHAIELILKLSERGEDFAESVLLAVARAERYGESSMSGVTPRLRLALFELLCDIFPPSEEQFESGMHEVTAREDVAHWRQGLLSGVIRDGSSEGLRGIAELAGRRPELNLDWAIVAAKESVRLNGWYPLAVGELRQALARPAARLARSNDDVQLLVLRALDELQDWLRGETPQAFALWNLTSDVRSPKDENHISDWYAHGLRVLLSQSGVVINREVEVSNRLGRGVGLRQDIRVEVRDPVLGEQYVTVVEVKGLWNSEVRTGLRSQLVDRYLRAGGLTHGVYLVVTFSELEMRGVPAKVKATRANRRNLSTSIRGQAAAAAPAFAIASVIHTADLPRA